MRCSQYHRYGALSLQKLTYLGEGSQIQDYTLRNFLLSTLADCEESGSHGSKEARNRWMLVHEHIKYVRELGVGGFGTVWLATLYGTKVAVKRNRQDTPTSLQLSASTSEFLKHADLRHPNIIQMIGFSLKSSEDTPEIEPVLVFEYMSNGTLEDWVFSERAPSWHEDIARSAMIGFDVLKALAYLQLNSPPIVHGDLKTGNVFLDSNFRAKIGDVAGSVNLYNTEGHEEIQITPLFSSPEQNRRVLNNDGTYATLSDDIYSFGAVLFEVLTRYDAYSDLQQPLDIVQGVAHGTRRLIDEVPGCVLQAAQDDTLLKAFITIIKGCTEFDQVDRPLIGDLLEAYNSLCEIIESREVDAYAIRPSAGDQRPRDPEIWARRGTTNIARLSARLD